MLIDNEGKVKCMWVDVDVTLKRERARKNTHRQFQFKDTKHKNNKKAMLEKVI